MTDPITTAAAMREACADYALEEAHKHYEAGRVFVARNVKDLAAALRAIPIAEREVPEVFGMEVRTDPTVPVRSARIEPASADEDEALLNDVLDCAAYLRGYGKARMSSAVTRLAARLRTLRDSLLTQAGIFKTEQDWRVQAEAERDAALARVTELERMLAAATARAEAEREACEKALSAVERVRIDHAKDGA